MSETFPADRQVVTAEAAFVMIPGYSQLEDSTIAYQAMTTLHDVMRATILEPSGGQLRVLSTLCGAVIVAPDSTGVHINRLIHEFFSVCLKRALPVRVAFTHGELEALVDVDGTTNFIGSPINVAARIAFNPANQSCLFHDSYVTHIGGSVVVEGAPGVFPDSAREITIQGKAHDAEAFRTRPAQQEIETADKLDPRALSPPREPLAEVTGMALAYDLPRFSHGERDQLSKRFRSVVSTFQGLRAEGLLPDANAVGLCPGGDGGVLVAPIRKSDAMWAALELIAALAVESDNKDPSIHVRSRVGLHYGVVPLYENAEGVRRPTGVVPLVADAILAAAGEHEDAVIFTEPFVDCVTRGQPRKLEEGFKRLAPAESGAARGIARFARRETAAPTPAAAPTPEDADLAQHVDRILRPSSPWSDERCEREPRKDAERET